MFFSMSNLARHSLAWDQFLFEALQRTTKSREDVIELFDYIRANRAECVAVNSFLCQGWEYVSRDPSGMTLPLALMSPLVDKSLKVPPPKTVGVPRVNREPRRTCIYVIRNNRNGYHKIGRSTNPRQREQTLQSEEPDIALVGFFVGTSKDEDSLHKRFESKRIRGEWFSLSDEDVAEIASMDGWTHMEGEEV